MTTDNAAAVRPKSLAGFEDDSEDIIPVPPRRRRAAAPSAPRTDESRAASAAASDGSAQSVPADDTSDAPTGPDEPAAQKSRPAPSKRAQGAKPKGSASNFYIHPDLAEKFEAKCREKNMFHGDLIIVAVEAAGEKLEQLLRHPTEETVGGTFFAARPSRPAKEEERKTQVNFSMLPEDFAALDAAVEHFKARSRNHLIVAALKGYLAD